MRRGGPRHEDLGQKKTLYEQTFKTRDYFCYDPETEELFGWTLSSEGIYQSLEPDENGRLWSSELEAWIGLWQGKYLETPGLWLRLFDEDNQLLPTTAEAAQAEADAAKAHAEALQAKADAERQKAERLAAQLRALGVEPEE